jgi:S-adenosylmethionine/arginine decarboxylase-like enzyme
VQAITFAHVSADLSGSPGSRLTDAQGLTGLLLAAANGAGLSPAAAPVVKAGPKGVAALLLCHGGHVALHALPEEGLCFADIAGLGTVHPQRGLEIIVRRLGAREVRTDARRRGPVTQATNPEGQ